LIRLATIDDIPELLRMGQLFFNASGYPDITDFNIEDTEKMLISLIDQGFVLTDGKSTMLGFLVYPVFMNASCLVSQELFWWVDEDKRNNKSGIEILKKAEELSKEYGATTMMMLSLKKLNGDRVNKLYERLGYVEREKTYMRAL